MNNFKSQEEYLIDEDEQRGEGFSWDEIANSKQTAEILNEQDSFEIFKSVKAIHDREHKEYGEIREEVAEDIIKQLKAALGDDIYDLPNLIF